MTMFILHLAKGNVKLNSNEKQEEETRDFQGKNVR
jgi:hypothetical protein